MSSAQESAQSAMPPRSQTRRLRALFSLQPSILTSAGSWLFERGGGGWNRRELHTQKAHPASPLQPQSGPAGEEAFKATATVSGGIMKLPAWTTGV